MSSTVVVDASVILHLLIGPDSAAEALSTRFASTAMHAPDYLAVDVSNTLRRRRNRGDLGAGEATLALQGLWSLPIQFWQFETVSARAWQLGHNLTSYDAAYVALAEQLDAPLITADRRLARASGPTCTFEVFDGDHG